MPAAATLAPASPNTGGAYAPTCTNTSSPSQESPPLSSAVTAKSPSITGILLRTSRMATRTEGLKREWIDKSRWRGWGKPRS
uniref:Uncharacterized protein n=1 Tax=Arundo donax TaxID=35708 RepID=A0A0A9H208_ARUDO